MLMDFVCKLYSNTYAVHVTVALVGVGTLNLALPAPPGFLIQAGSDSREGSPRNCCPESHFLEICFWFLRLLPRELVTKQNKKQNKTKQNKTKQNKTKQNKTKQKQNKQKTNKQTKQSKTK